MAATSAIIEKPQAGVPPLSALEWGGAWFGVAGLVIAGSVLAMYWPLAPAALLGAIAVGIWCCRRPSRWLYLVFATMFLESSSFSLFVVGARLRPAQLLALAALAMVALYSAGGLVRLRRVPLLAPLLLYLACNFLSALRSSSPPQCFKILFLLVVCVVVYAVAYTLVRDDPAAWPTLLRFFLLIGFLEISYGLYQVAAGLANARLGLSLPIGERGLFQADFLGTSFGRPYGTFVEPDTFGAVCLFYALLLGLIWLTASNRLCGSGPAIFVVGVVAMVGLLVGFVRASWLGFLIGLMCALPMQLFGRSRPLRFVRLAPVGYFALLIMGSVLALSPEIRAVLARRFERGPQAGLESFSLRNTRFIQMQASYRLFRRQPLLGNGPGSFSVLGILPGQEEFYLEPGAQIRVLYDPSLVTTVLDDTGLLGAAAFVILAMSYFRYVRRCRRRMSDSTTRSAAAAAHCALIGLFASFLFTHYFWVPFTWVFLAIVVLLHEFGGYYLYGSRVRRVGREPPE